MVIDVDPVVDEVPVQLSDVQLPHPDLLTLQVRLINVHFVYCKIFYNENRVEYQMKVKKKNVQSVYF